MNGHGTLGVSLRVENFLFPTFSPQEKKQELFNHYLVLCPRAIYSISEIIYTKTKWKLACNFRRLSILSESVPSASRTFTHLYSFPPLVQDPKDTSVQHHATFGMTSRYWVRHHVPYLLANHWKAGKRLIISLVHASVASATHVI